MKNLKMQALWCCCMMYILEKLKYFPKKQNLYEIPYWEGILRRNLAWY